ncbi:unnamed protein product [Caenorhabditis sp. 36 PRJEB53466]|nr:unnamed protein product [Caenorhabditis sp. 36 PRJEB53466]
MKLLLLLAALIAHVCCSGHMKIDLKSKFRLPVTVIVRHENKTIISLPIGLSAQKDRHFGPFPIEFNENYTLLILGAKTEELGVTASSYRGEFSALRGSIAPKKLDLPLSGLKLSFECDPNWTGERCDTKCSYCFVEETDDRQMKLETDYTIDQEKLPTIIERLKETTKVDNEMSENGQNWRMRKQEQEEEKIKEERTKKDSKKKSLFSDLFKSIFSLNEGLAGMRENNEEREVPIVIDMQIGDDSKESQPLVQTSLSSYRSPFAVDKKEEIEKHGAVQKMLGLRHSKPFAYQGVDSVGLFGPAAWLLDAMPRIARNSAEGSGSISDDFSLDQIIRN